jgi:mono/diheme cytochrome c family protein
MRPRRAAPYRGGMTRRWRIAGVAAAVLGVALGVGIQLTVGWTRAGRIVRGAVRGPAARPLAAASFERTPQRIARGRYLAEGLLRCFDCHSERDWTAPGAPPVAGKVAGGAGAVEEDAPFPLFSPNISPDPETGAGRWTDDMLARAVREGIGHDGRALIPAMPYRTYRALSDEDTAALVVYLRSMPAVRNPVPRNRLPFPFRYLVNGFPQPLTGPVAAPDPVVDPVARGSRLAALAACGGCHDGRSVDGRRLPFGGGGVARGPWGAVAATNLTRDASGIAHYDEAVFVQTIRTGRVAGVRALSPYMPWFFYRNLDDGDLRAIYAYLMSLPPVVHRVNNTDPPSPCRLCGKTHGLGERN